MKEDQERGIVLQRKGLHWLTGSTLFLITLALYWQTGEHGLLNLDDYNYLYGSKQLVKGLSLENLKWALCYTDQGFWAPLTWASYLFDFSFFGGSVGAMHLHNAVLHALNTFLVFRLLLLLGRMRETTLEKGNGAELKPNQWPLLITAFLATAFWAWHPLRVEPVAWIASRKDMVFAFWELLALVLWVARIGQKDWREQAYYVASIICFGFACMGKPTAMTFPLLAVMLDYLCHRKLEWGEYVVPGLIALAVGLAGGLLQSEAEGTSALAEVPIHGRVLNAAVALGRYCLSSVWPSGLAVQCLHRWPQPPAMLCEGLLASSVLGSVLVWAGIRCWRRDVLGPASKREENVGDGWAKVFFVAFGFFILSIGPTLGIANFGYHALADRFTYLPTVGFSILVMASLQWGFNCGQKFLYAGVIVSGVILAVLSWVSFRQIAIWKDERTLYEQTLKVDGEGNHLAVQALGIYHYEQDHDLEKAVSYFRRGAALNFEFAANIYAMYVIVLVERGEMEEARREASRYSEWSDRELTRRRDMLSLDEQDRTPMRCFETQLIFAALSIGDGDYALAKEHLQNVLKERPRNTFANYLSGVVMLKEGDREGAIGYWEKSLNGDIKEYVRHRFLKRRIAELKSELKVNQEANP
jgi:hypothetical protein